MSRGDLNLLRDTLSHTYEMMQKPEKIPDSTRSSSTGISWGGDSDEDVVVVVIVDDSIGKNSEGSDESWAKSKPSR